MLFLEFSNALIGGIELLLRFLELPLKSNDEIDKAFRVDPRFEVNLFAGEEQFPDIVNPIQMRWDARGLSLIHI